MEYVTKCKFLNDAFQNVWPLPCASHIMAQTNHMRQIGYWQSHLNWIKFSLFLPSNTFLSITLQLVQNKYSWRGGSWDISYICFCGSGQLKQWQVCWMGNLAFWTTPLNNSAQLNVKCKVLKQQFQECIKIQGWLTLKQHKQDLTLCMVRSELSWQMKEAAASRLKLFCSLQLKCFLKHWM